MKFVKSLLLKLVIDGEGIVNFDSNDQRFTWNRIKSSKIVRESNVSFGKANYEEVEFEGEKRIIRYPKISSDCLRHAMWETEMPDMIPHVMLDTDILINILASPAVLERGNMDTEKGMGAFARKSPVTLTAACTKDPVIPALEVYSTSSPKEKNLDEDKGATSFFYKEVRGKLKYYSSGGINVKDLGFISLSDLHGRLAFPPDKVSEYRNILGERIGSEIGEPDYYNKKGDLYGACLPEYGILLSDEQNIYLIKDILRRICIINIQRATTGYARTQALYVKPVYDPTSDLFDDEDDWLTIKDDNTKFDTSKIDSFSFEKEYFVDDKGKEKIEAFNEKKKEEINRILDEKKKSQEKSKKTKKETKK